MTFTDAAAEVLRLVGRPLHYKEITDIAIEKNLLSHVGKSPEVTMGARLAATLKKDTAENPLVRVKPGVFALRAWDDKTRGGGEGRRGGRRSTRPEAPGRGRGKEQEGDAAAPEGELAAEGEEALEASPTDADGELEAAASEAFEPAADSGPERDEPVVAGALPPIESILAEEEDDDEPILGRDSEPRREPPAPRAAAAAYRGAVDEERAGPAEPDEIMRAEAAARATEMFDEEDDDDQPILGGDDRAAGAAGEGDGRRRRRRRRRGRGGAEGQAAAPAPGSANGLPSYTAVPVDARRDDGRREDARRDDGRRDDGRRDGRDAVRPAMREDVGEPAYRGPQVIELTGGDGHALDDLGGRDLADAIVALLSTFDRNAGAVSLRQIAETAQRRGRLNGDAQLVQSQIAAAVRADNQRRLTLGQRPRFRFAGGRVALTDWLLGGDLMRLEQEALAAVERYREAARRAFARKLGELPGHAFVEICMLVLERMGLSQIRAVRRPGAPSGETSFSALLRPAGDDVRVALVIRRDAREIGRERVVELRGSLHHYGPAAMGFILTAGQVLSGARDESAIPGAAPITLYDGLTLARLCEEHEVAVIRARLPIAIPDVDLLEALRAS